MSQVSQAFDSHRDGSLFGAVPANTQQRESGPAWEPVQHGALPPMMFQLRFRDGHMVSYAFSDLREVRYRDAGYLQLGILGLERVVVTIEGRHLRKLADLLACGMVRWIEETDEYDVDRPETEPAIAQITVAVEAE